MQGFFDKLHQEVVARYRGKDDTPLQDGVPLRDVLADRLRGGHGYLLLLTSILDDPMDRRATTGLEGEDAAVVLDILAKVRVHPSIRIYDKIVLMLSMLTLFRP